MGAVEAEAEAGCPGNCGGCHNHCGGCHNHCGGCNHHCDCSHSCSSSSSSSDSDDCYDASNCRDYDLCYVAPDLQGYWLAHARLNGQDRCMDVCELRWAYKCGCQQCAPPTAEELFEQFDRNEDCCLDFTEFEALVATVRIDHPEWPQGSGT